MFVALAQMSLLILCGTLWRRLAPDHIPVQAHRRALTDLVFYLLLPALVLDVIWRTSLNLSAFSISFLAVGALATALIAMLLTIRYIIKVEPKQAGALMLAAAFPNVTYLGLPVLDQIIGPSSQPIVLQYDLFAFTPILLTFGLLMARHYGNSTSGMHPIKELLKVPPLWAVSLALILNLSGVPEPEILHASLSLLAGGVVPLMLIALGMSIRWESLKFSYLPLLLPVVLISLFIAPASVYLFGSLIDLDSSLLPIVVLLTAMPTMVFGIVICERYQLDSELYAAAVSLTTLLSLFSLPLWFYLLTGA